MDIITRNFFRLLYSGALHENEKLEPMSHFKWQRLEQMVHVQHVEDFVVKGLNEHNGGEWTNVPYGFLKDNLDVAEKKPCTLSNAILNKRLKRIEHNEIRSMETNVGALDVLKIIVDTVSMMLNHGMMLKGILTLGCYLRAKGDKVDFLKLDKWIKHLHLRRMAQLQGSMLITVFHFEKDELPFVQRIEPAAYKLVVRSVAHTASDTAEEWHFRQNNSGFVTNNSALLRRNLRRSLRYLAYAPMETISNYFSNFARSLQEIEE